MSYVADTDVDASLRLVSEPDLCRPIFLMKGGRRYLTLSISHTFHELDRAPPPTFSYSPPEIWTTRAKLVLRVMLALR